MSTGAVRVYLCRCGPNLPEHLSFDAMAAELRREEGVSEVVFHDTLCSPEGQQWMQGDLRASRTRRFVVAGCSPREHGHTFMAVSRRAGRNPYWMAMANIREQCAWVTPDRRAATRKATALVRAAVARALRQQALVEREIACSPDVAVIGAGVAGLTAARLLAEGGRRVVLVEREPYLGGRATLLADLFPGLECASCLLTPLVDAVLHHPRIEVLTLGELEQVLGYQGNYTITVRVRSRHVDAASCYGCATCHEVCPVEAPRRADSGLSQRKAIYLPHPGAVPHVSCIDESTCLYFKDGSCRACASACPFGNIRLEEQDRVLERQVGALVVASGAELAPVEAGPAIYSAEAFERLLSSDGPTRGEVRLRSGRAPRTIALVHGVDETGRGPGGCDSVSCRALGKYAAQLRRKLPRARVQELLSESCALQPGRCATEERAEPIRLLHGDRLQVLADGERARVDFTVGGTERSLLVELAVVMPPLRGGAGTRALAQLLRLKTDAEGFVAPDSRLRPFATRAEGILVAGCAQAPMDTAAAASMGAAAAGAALAALVPGRRLALDPARAEVVPERCGGCRLCSKVCPYRAVTFDSEARVARVEETLCRGCGTCAAACPSAAIVARHFTSDQIEAEVLTLLAGDSAGEPPR